MLSNFGFKYLMNFLIEIFGFKLNIFFINLQVGVLLMEKFNMWGGLLFIGYLFGVIGV